MGKITIILALMAMLLLTIWFAVSSWIAIEAPAMPASAYVAMAFGILFTIVVGVGLMALVFYSHRHGYDEPHGTDTDRR